MTNGRWAAADCKARATQIARALVAFPDGGTKAMEASGAIQARLVFPADGPPLRNATVCFRNGRIESVGPREARTDDWGDVALLPGLVNAHTHLEFSDLPAPLPADGQSFSAWIRQVIAWRIRQAKNVPESKAWRDSAIRRGLHELLAGGTTSFGEIATPPWSGLPYSDGGTTGRGDLPQPLSGVTFLELLGLHDERHNELLAEATTFCHSERPQGTNLRAGLSPHSPYTVAPTLLAKIVRLAVERELPVAMHLAESVDEIELLRTGGGPLRELLIDVGAWQDGIFGAGARPLDYLIQLQAACRTLVIHGNLLDREEIEFLGQHRDRMSVVYCPRTHDYLGSSPYPLGDFLKAGVRVALGTDSRASNPDLNLLAELRFVARRFPAIAPDDLLRMATLAGAEALGLEDEVGSLTRGKHADFVAVSCSPDERRNPYDVLLGSEQNVVAVIRRGRLVFRADSWKSAFEESPARRSPPAGP